MTLLPGALMTTPALAQPASFGSSDDPREESHDEWWNRQNRLDLQVGPSLIGPQWRAASGFELNLDTRSLTARLSGRIRAGIYGEYEPDINEPYDILRLVEFARYNPPRNSPFYVRAGLINRLTLGTGHIVNFHNSWAAWDDRTIGAETQWYGQHLQVSAFTDDVLFDGVAGGRAAVTPLAFVPDARLRTLTLGFSYVTDLQTRGDTHPELAAYNVDASVNLFDAGDIVLSPFATFAWYSQYGKGIGIGADLWSMNFIDFARFRFRFALYYNGDQFIPGYIGSFYTVHNTRDRIVNTVNFLEEQENERLVGLALGDAVGGNDLVTELRLLLLRRFELWHYFRRHYGSQALSEYHLRLFVQTRDRLNLSVGLDRGNLRGFSSLFGKLGDQTTLFFDAEYRFAGPFWTYIRSRYAYEQIGEAPSGGARYLVQRRFEPMVGFRLHL